jgi:hypothetical protein
LIREFESPGRRFDPRGQQSRASLGFSWKKVIFFGSAVSAFSLPEMARSMQADDTLPSSWQ